MGQKRAQSTKKAPKSLKIRPTPQTHVIFLKPFLCCVMFCCVLLCYIVLCFVLCCSVCCCVMLCYVVLCCFIFCCVVSCCVWGNLSDWYNVCGTVIYYVYSPVLF